MTQIHRGKLVVTGHKHEVRNLASDILHSYTTRGTDIVNDSLRINLTDCEEGDHQGHSSAYDVLQNITSWEILDSVCEAEDDGGESSEDLPRCGHGCRGESSLSISHTAQITPSFGKELLPWVLGFSGNYGDLKFAVLTVPPEDSIYKATAFAIDSGGEIAFDPMITRPFSNHRDRGADHLPS